MSLDVAARSTQIRNDSSVTTPRSDAAALVVRALGEHDDGVAWNAFVSAATNAELYHDFRWRAVIAKVFGHESCYLAAYDAGGVVRGVLPLVLLQSRLFGRFLVSMPFLNYGGLLAPDLDARRLLLEAAVGHAAQTGAGHVELRHRLTDLDWPKRTDKVAMVLDLPTSEETLFKTFASKLRAQIRRPQKAGATVGFGGAELLDDFYARSRDARLPARLVSSDRRCFSRARPNLRRETTRQTRGWRLSAAPRQHHGNPVGVVGQRVQPRGR
jgi:hypothetical protein